MTLSGDWYFFVFDFARYGIVTSFPITSNEKCGEKYMAQNKELMEVRDEWFQLDPSESKAITLGEGYPIS
jgi:hypothetical protein